MVLINPIDRLKTNDATQGFDFFLSLVWSAFHSAVFLRQPPHVRTSRLAMNSLFPEEICRHWKFLKRCALPCPESRCRQRSEALQTGSC